MAKVKKKTKAELLQEAVAEAVGAGRELHLESVDFSDPNRPKTCLEVDFPILPINHVAAIEGNAGKPIYQMSKWWARRRSSVFRAMLIAAATRAPEDQGEAAKTVWDAYYGNHQKNEAFRKLKVADIFMGGGTTIVEGTRLGMQMYGNDLNPVAWLVVKNELAQVDAEEVQKVLDAIEVEVKPQIMPFYACDCPRGHKGKWTHKLTGEVMGTDFDPLSLRPDQRPEYEYVGPEMLHVFWIKHGPCQTMECNHRTPIMSSPVVAVKTLTVKAWTGKKCHSCGKAFDVEKQDARMAPAAMQIVTDADTAFAVMDDEGNYACPHCGHQRHDQSAAIDGESSFLGKAKNKAIHLSLLVHPEWLRGSPSANEYGDIYGGSLTDDPAATERWITDRAKQFRLVEVRGELPPSLILPDFPTPLLTGDKGGNVPKKSHFSCGSCGAVHDVLKAMSAFGRSGPLTPSIIQGFCPSCNEQGEAYGGRFFSPCENVGPFAQAEYEWSERRNKDLSECWPKTELPEGFKTTYQRIPEHGYPRFIDFFNSRQALVHSQFVKCLQGQISKPASKDAAEYVLGAFQQFLRNECMFSFWHRSHDHFAPALSNNNYHPKPILIEIGAFCPIGYGPWQSTLGSLIETAEWRMAPWDIVCNFDLQNRNLDFASNLKGKGTRVSTGDQVVGCVNLSCGSATQLPQWGTSSLDLIITDPPFGNNIQYSELADFFHVWVRLLLKDQYSHFHAEVTPKTVEAVVNPVRNPTDPDGFYQRLLTECWREAFRVLKPGGVMAFTFHHSEDEPWVAVLESLFQAGFYLEAAYPIRSDETKGEGAKPGTFGSQLIEYDIVHVCRKRLVEPEVISWARLRRQIMQDVRQLQEIIEQHQKEGLGEADLQVIRRGKALEYYSRHYGKVYIEKGREDEFTVRDALVGINQLLDDESDTTSEAPPVLAEPYTRQFLRLFADRTSLDRDQIQKHLRGTGVSPTEFLERGWCSEARKVFTITPPLEWAQQWKGQSRKKMSRDFDQTYFLIGASYEESGIKVSDTLNSGSFVPHPAIGDLLDWFVKHGSDDDMKAAAYRAKQIYSTWLAKNKPQAEAQQTLFDLESDE